MEKGKMIDYLIATKDELINTAVESDALSEIVTDIAGNVVSEGVAQINIKEVNIGRSKPELLRIVDYILQIKNPYYYKVGNTKVRVSYADTDHTVTDCFLEMLKWM